MRRQTIINKRRALIQDYAKRCAHHRKRKANWNILRDLTTAQLKAEIREERKQRRVA